MPTTPEPILERLWVFTTLDLGLLVLGALVVALLVYRLGRWVGFRQFQRAYAAALQGFADETVRRERVWQGRLDLHDQTHASKTALLDRELAEARAAERVHRALAARYQGWLEGRRFPFLPPRPDDARLAEVLRAHDALVEASARLARAARRAADRRELPVDAREELEASLDDPGLGPAGRPVGEAQQAS